MLRIKRKEAEKMYVFCKIKPDYSPFVCKWPLGLSKGDYEESEGGWKWRSLCQRQLIWLRYNRIKFLLQHLIFWVAPWDSFSSVKFSPFPNLNAKYSAGAGPAILYWICIQKEEIFFSSVTWNVGCEGMNIHCDTFCCSFFFYQPALESVNLL